ncbi:MAG: large subunit ribosomal protein L32e [Methanosaeta sp. ASP1-1]|nr:rpmF [Methanomicrobia archaeon]MDD1721886.1 50S ribosomal protein L32e [Methanothrix sp.]MRR13856.1 50S ribosomal protein L32e [archaeon]OYV08576.1 MAG: large subunit ribosomal protein L32e [Methanosaeta sp. ASP1-1]OYV09232.1 MAG: large subunit ribosomal protein L32e [Methanosaeta sp. NSP1]OYV11397.1 MAG: large subunit ribosomal protein L32e [Methanosaeta sp. ASO1]OYV12605.1 MAG: large subunit ribosomal protein L32e [Methanosaeta sp. NSM2]OYV13333.1 MAG: large subunit ribosomal protein L3
MAERLLRVRTRQKSKKPEFNFHDSHKKKRLATSWRKPRGLHNKLRQQIAAKGKLVRPGFGSPKAVRGYHPCGLPEVLVNNVAELEKAQGFAVRIASAVGRRKRLDIEAKAAQAGLKVLNAKGGA